jgi:glycosyltransferase involved in cell wall biosynthesis
LIKELATKPIENPLFKNDLYSIISIGRVSYQKQFTKIPSIASKLKQYGCKFYWYIIGDGPEKQKLEEEITKHNVADTVILLCKQNNPYKYLAKANLFALTSVYESYPTVINEALVLNIPIISNDIPPIYEMLNDKQGFIATIEEFPQRIKWIIDNNWQIQSKTTDCWVKRHNDFVMTMFYNLIENN